MTTDPIRDTLHEARREGWEMQERKMTPDPELDALLEKAKGHVMTADERFEQAVSFVYGQLMDCARPPTKEQVRKQLAEHYGRES